jgi:hypothetical protein
LRRRISKRSAQLLLGLRKSLSLSLSLSRLSGNFMMLQACDKHLAEAAHDELKIARTRLDFRMKNFADRLEEVVNEAREFEIVGGGLVTARQARDTTLAGMALEEMALVQSRLSECLEAVGNIKDLDLDEKAEKKVEEKEGPPKKKTRVESPIL